MSILPYDEKWVGPRLDVSSMRWPDMSGLFRFMETVFIHLINVLLAGINCHRPSQDSPGLLHTNKLLMTMKIGKTTKSGRRWNFYIQRFNVCKVSFRPSKVDGTSSSRLPIKLIISLLVYVQKCHYYFNYCCLDWQTMIRKWTCIFCGMMKSASHLDWMCLLCDDLICLGCFRSQKLFLQSCNKCPSCIH